MEGPSATQQLTRRMCRFLRQASMLFSCEEEEGLIWFSIGGFSESEGTIFDVTIETEPDHYRVTVLPHEELTIEPDRIARAIEFVSRVNFVVGCNAFLDLDVDSGKVACVYTADCVDPPTEGTLCKSAFIPPGIFARFFDALKKIMSEDDSVEDILAGC